MVHKWVFILKCKTSLKEIVTKKKKNQCIVKIIHMNFYIYFCEQFYKRLDKIGTKVYIHTNIT